MKSIGGEIGALNGDLHYLFKLYANRTARWKKGDCLTGFQLRDVSFMSPDPFFKTGSLGDFRMWNGAADLLLSTPILWLAMAKLSVNCPG